MHRRILLPLVYFCVLALVRGLAPRRHAIHHHWGFAGKPKSPKKRTPGQLWKRPAAIVYPDGSVGLELSNTVPVETLVVSDGNPKSILTVDPSPAMNHGNVPVYVTRDHTDGSESPPPATSEQPPAATVTSLDVPDQSEFVTSDQSDFVTSDQSDSVTSDQSDFVTSDHTDGSEPPPPPTSVQPPAATVTSLDVPDQPNASVENPPTTNSEDPVSPSPQRPKPAEDTDDCSKCFIIYKYVDVYYPPAASSVTDCLTELDLAGVPTPTIPPGLKQEGDNAYIVVPELSAGNRCTKITEFTSLTFTFAPGELSTIQGPANITKEFNFGDLPCPPPDISSDAHWFYNPSFNPTQTYAPLVAPFSQLYDLHPAFKDCIVADNQGFDPAIALPPADAPTLPDLRGNFGPQIDGRGLPGLDRLKPREVPMVAHKVAYMPLETGSPALSDKDQGRD